MSRLPQLLAPDALIAARQRRPAIRLLDVRTPVEFSGGHIAGSYNVPLDRLGAHAGELRAVGAPIVLVCRSGARARSAERMLGGAGVRDLHILDGGVLAWRGSGGQLERAAGAAAASLRRILGMAGVAAAFILLGRGYPIAALLLGVAGLRTAFGLPLLPCAVAGGCATGAGDDAAAAVRACVAGTPPSGAARSGA